MGTIVQFVQPSTEETLTQIAHGPDNTRVKFLGMFPKPQALTRQSVVAAFQDAFQQIGGTSRLALWADSHPDEFFKLYARLLPAASDPSLNGDTERVIRHILPPTALDHATAETPTSPAPPPQLEGPKGE